VLVTNLGIVDLTRWAVNIFIDGNYITLV